MYFLLKNLRFYFPTSLGLPLDALSLMFTNAFNELAELSQRIKIGEEPIFNLIPVLGAGRSATSVDDMITCELFARKSWVCLIYSNAFIIYLFFFITNSRGIWDYGEDNEGWGKENFVQIHGSQLLFKSITLLSNVAPYSFNVSSIMYQNV